MCSCKEDTARKLIFKLVYELALELSDQPKEKVRDYMMQLNVHMMNFFEQDDEGVYVKAYELFKAWVPKKEK